MSTGQNSQSNEKDNEKEIYFIILRPSEEKVNLDLKFSSEMAPQRIFTKSIEKGKNSFLEHNVFKLNIKKTEKKENDKKEKDKKEKDKKQNYKIEYIEGEDAYDILFSVKENTFIYDTELKKGNKWLDNIVKEDIDQTIIPLYNKLDLFLEALEANDENYKKEKLYDESIDLYQKKKKFSLLISLFLKIYEHNKDLCSKLIKIFNEINDKENTDKDKELSIYVDTFNQIYSNADDIIKDNGYDSINFYGILFCYLSNYDKDNFSKIIKGFSEGNADILYEILIIYYSHLKIPLNQDLEFYNNFISYAIKKQKKLNLLNRILNYIDDIETFLYVINENKAELVKNYNEFKNNPIELSSNLNLIKKENNGKKEIDIIIKLIGEIIKYSDDNQLLIIYLKSEFWINLLKQYNKPDLENINSCYRLRLIYKDYNNLINVLYNNNTDENKIIIKKDINKYYLRDEFAFILNDNIKKFLEINNDALLDQEKLGIVEKYNPYYNNKDEADIERYKNNRETSIFNNIHFNNPTKAFKETFKMLDFETMFKENLVEFINKIISKIEDISTFGTVMELINITRIEKKKKDYYDLLKDKYELIIKNQINQIKEEKELDKAVKILSEFISRIFLEEDNNDFLDEKIGKLDDRIKSLIYNELMKTYNDKKYEKMKQYIYDIFLNKLEDIDNIIKLIDSLSKEDKKDFLVELMKKCEFQKEEFYSNSENKKIKLLCYLNEKQKLEIKYNGKIENILDDIRNDLEIETGSILKKNLEQFLNLKNIEKKLANKKEEEEKIIKDEDKKKQEKDNKDDNDEEEKRVIIQKLGLIKLVLENYDPIKKYGDLKKIILDINEKIIDLNFIKNSLLIFHRKQYGKEIKDLTNIIENIETKPIKEFKTQKMKESIDDLLKLKVYSEEINKVKDLLLFKKIFEKSKGSDQEERFQDAKSQLDKIKELFKKQSSNKEQSLNIEIIFQNFENIFKDIKDELSKKEESKSDEFIKQMENFFDIKNEENQKDLSIIIKSKKYEMVVKSIKFFFENFSNKKLILPKNIELSEMNLIDLKRTLKKLKDSNIYDYESNSPFYKLFISFYEKKEAIDFLLEKIGTNIDHLKDKLDPSIKSISIKDIEDAIECLNQFKNLIKLNAPQIIENIKDLDPETIERFVSYSKHYPSIIELDRKNEKDMFEEVYKIVEDASLIFRLDNEYFCYTIDDKKIQKNINDLIDLKNKININTENSKKKEGEKKNEEKDENINEDKKDLFQTKCDKLIFFKDIVSKIEAIYDKIKILRIKGYNIPIMINIIIKYPKVAYKFQDEEKEFSEIKNYLFTIKNDYENQLNKIYQNEKYLRFLYGKLFRKIKLHQEGNCEVLEIIRYILNKSDYKDIIKDGEPYNVKLGEDFWSSFKDHTKKIFSNMSKYIISLFEKNDLNYQKHYENILIKGEKKYKGIYLFKCENLSMEQYILYLFQEKLGKLPIAQNILICSNETSIEEMQSFFYRAILCDYNTLFVIEILESFSNFQHNKMYSYIDKLLSYKLENSENKNINKSSPREYLNSCIFFVYKNLENESSFLNELGKYTIQKQDKVESLQPDNEKENTMGDLNISNILNISDNSFNDRIMIQDKVLCENIKVFSSDVCGLGKSFKIKKLIKEKNEIYYHFPLGGILSKKIIYEKILKLLQKIKKDAKIKKGEENKKNKKNIKDEEDKKDEEYLKYNNNVAIHLDLIESKETSLINEFLFSFLITKFYTNNEDIIYIPNNIKIYVEIPNSFENYLTKFGILNVFEIEHIELGKLPNLELDKNIRQIFNRMIGKETNEEIEEFIKENIGIKEYSYHQVKTFINLFINQFSIFDSKLKFTNSQDDDITNKCIKDFAQSTKYFTNGGFAKLIMDKKQHIKDKIDLCLDAYENDLNNVKFKTPLIFVDKKTMKCNLEILPDISDEEKQSIKINRILNKEVDIVYLIDATGSMGYEINAAKEYCIHIFKELKNKYDDYNFLFGAVFYRDKIDCEGEKDEYFPLTDKMEDLKHKISTIKAYGGGDTPEDWVGGYKIALNNMKWRKGIKLIIHIADAGAHGEEFSKGDKYPEQGPLLLPLIKECAQKNINIIGFKISETPKRSFEKMTEIYNDYKLTNKDNGQFIEIYDFDRKDSKAVSENFHKLVIEAANQVINPSYKYLKRLKQILYLENDLEKDIGDKKSLLSILDSDNINYVITEDNYKKMVLLIYRIKANVPVIIMGETGCGKTSLIVKLSQILNNGKSLVQIINIHPGITDEEICKKMKDINENAKKQEYINEKKNIKKELWVFFDEINTCLSLSLLTEIFINRTFNGEKLEENIRLIGACNPYRRRKSTAEKCGLTREDDKEDELVYKVEQLPQSLLYYVFSFGSIKEEDEKKYIRSIIQIIFNKDEEELHKLTTEAISKCHIFLRETFEDPSVVSLREIARFKNCVEFFQDYFLKKNNQNKNKIDDDTKKYYKIKSIICSIYLCYYIRLITDEKRGRFDAQLQKILLKIVNVYSEEKDDDEENKSSNLFDKIQNEKLKEDLIDKNIDQFSDLLKIEEEFLLTKIDLEKGVGKNELLKENLFLLFLAVVTKIPVIIVGKPGTGKSLSAQLLYNSMKGEYSKKEFFKKYPPIIQIYFQGSESTRPEDVTELFNKAEGLYKSYITIKKKDDVVPIYMILFDELGLAEKASTNPLKVLHSKLEYDGKSEGVCFIGISNYSLDAAKVNRALSLSVPNLEEKLDQLKTTSKSIVESISPDISKDTSKLLIFNILSRAYQLYKYYLIFIKKLIVLKKYIKNKEELKGKDLKEIERQLGYKKLLKKEEKIKSEFHGNRDFYNIIKGVAIEGSKLNNISDENQIIPIIENYIERNFGGISYELDINFELEANDIKEDMEKLKNEILKEKVPKLKLKKNESNREEEKDKIIKVTSVYLFKKIYNEACTLENNDKDNIKGVVYKIKDDHMDKYDLNKCINDNINDNNSRYLLLEIKSNLAPLINQIIRKQNPDKKDIDFINGSPFLDDNNNEYKIKKVGEIQNSASKQDKLIILQNLDPIQPYLYDLYNMNYKIIDEQKFVRICLDNFSEDLTPVNDSFRIIILVDKKFVNSTDMAFLNRLEKMKISFKDLLNNNQKELQKKIINEIRLKEEIKKEHSRINYDLNHLLINCSEQEIGGLVYYYFLENKKETINEDDIKEQIYSKISNILPQDIITNLSEKNPIKKKYFGQMRYNNFISYINNLESARKNKTKDNYKISIIYTFSSIANIIEGYNKTEQIMITEIRTEDKLKSDIDDIKNKNRNEDQEKYIILINFEQYNSNKIQFISDYINNYCKDDGYNYIFIIHIQRSFNIEKKSKKEKAIYSIPNIYENINQLFIDNLQGSDISLNDLLKKSIKDVMFNAETFKNLDNEFKDILINFVYEEMHEKNKNETNEKSITTYFSTYLNDQYDEKSKIGNLNEEKYSDEITKYMIKDIEFRNDLIKKAKELIEIDKDAQGDCQSLINKMFKEHHINKNSIDIISCILDYIKENIFKKYLQYIFKVLEHNNFLTTLIEISNDKNSKLDKNDKSTKNDKGNRIIIKELKSKFLEQIKVDDSRYEPKFLFNYKIPGFYNFYKDLSDYLIKNITVVFFNNEKKLRDFSKKKHEEAINIFHEKEKDLLNKVLERISQDKLYFDLINKITPDLILKDYITFYLEKTIGCYSKGFLTIIELLLSLRFSEEKEIIKENKYNPINIIILKIIWIESNSNYIESLLKAFEISKDIINDKDGIELNQIIYDIIYDIDNPIKYISDEKRNPEFKREINECFYIILAGLCLSITENIKLVEITIKDYHDRLIVINNILQILNHDLNIYLNELFIIDELIKIIEYELDRGIENIKNIEIIRKYLIENSKIIQKNRSDKFSQLRENFINLNNKLKEEKDERFKKKYYDTLTYIYLQEINKINKDTYHAAILGELMKEKDIIKNSNDILEILLESYIEIDPDTQKDLLDNEDNDVIIQLINQFLSDNTTDYYLALSETIIYFFEKNSLIYLEDILEDESLSGEPLDIFIDCNKFLSKFKTNATKYHGKLVNITKLFCIGYIKSYCYTFIEMHDKSEFKPDEIIKQINKCDEIKMVKLYIYKIIYNLNKKQINVFLNDASKAKYNLDKYEGFKDFIKFKNEEIYISDNDNYKDIYKKLDDYQKDGFKNEIAKEDISSEGKFNFDDFYMAAYNLILSKLKQKDFETDNIYINFYHNVCEPLFKKDDDGEDSNKLLLLIQFLFEKEKYLEIKKAYKINPEDIEVLFYGYRYCLNEISEEYNDKEDYIYTSLYDLYKLDYLDKNFYPGSDTKEEEPYYELYNKIENHFKEKPNQGCYVCLCNKGYYHSVPSGFPSYSETNIKCPNCGKDIGAKEKYLEEKDEKEDKIKLHKIYETIKRDKYFRILKDKNEIDKLERYKDKYNKLKEVNYMTKEEFKEKYIKPLYNKEKGLNKINENNFKKDNKKIRNLSQIAYRLLNYILYSHLFFAKLFTSSEKFDNYLPRGMTWFNTIKECYILLQKELEKKGIKEIEIFMNFIFKDLFSKLHDKECIKNYEDLIKFENELEELIQEKFKHVKNEIDKFKKFEKESINDQSSGIALLKEIYDKSEYNPKNYPYYEHFYYTDYLNEEYINNILEHKDKDEYLILSQYLEPKKKKKKTKDKYSLENLIIFNKVLNLFQDKYSNQITREFAEKTNIKNSDIYAEAPKNEKDAEVIKADSKKKKEKDSKKKKDPKKKKIKIKDLDNKGLIDEFIKLYNSFELEEVNESGEKEKMKLDVDKNCICDFLLVDDNKYGKTYKKIYKIFIEKQNEDLENLLDKKINIGIFNNNCKNTISVQQIKENEIFTFNIPEKKFNFIEVIFNSSYRKVIDTQNYEDYNEYKISLDSIETKMTNLLIKNKKLLNNELIGFIYNNEVFSNEINDLICNFKYGDMKANLSIDDKVIIYNYIIHNDDNKDKYIIIIDNFITLIEYLNKIKDNNEINENTKISEIEIIKKEKNISKDFHNLFEDKNDKDNNDKNNNDIDNNYKDNNDKDRNDEGRNDLVVNKIPNLFDYYLKIIFKYIKRNIEKYQEKKEKEGDIKKENDNVKMEEEKPKFNLDEKIIKNLNNIFAEKDMIITKESLASAIRLFISLVLYREKEKEKDKKIKSNRKNIIEYLKAKDLWEANIYNNEKFEDNLEKIKSVNIKIKEILCFIII